MSLLLLAVATCGSSARGAEADVHFGLTKFLALQAGFTPGQSDAIALGDLRVESGDMQFMGLVLDYGCLAPDPELAQEAAARHYPTAAKVPGSPAQRNVVAAGEAVTKELASLKSTDPSQAGFLLYRLAHALHALQDSYLHEGVPDIPQFAPYFSCDPTLAWGHPRARGGWNSHAADLTRRWPRETLAMAKATYDALVAYTIIGKTERKPKPWAQVQPLLDGFIKAGTKAEKQAWFNAHGITDTAFLAGISLKDGPQPFELEWGGRRLPKLTATQSRQHATDPALLEYFSRFFTDWLSTDDFEALAAAHVAPLEKTRGGKSASFDKTELAARLRLWRIRDHGAVAELAHAPDRLTTRQLKDLAALAKAPAALAHYPSPTQAVFPLITNDKDASPLLPFIVRAAPASASGNPRAVAIAKLMHAPYDTIGVVAERFDGNWKVIALVAAVDH